MSWASGPRTVEIPTLERGDHQHFPQPVGPRLWGAVPVAKGLRVVSVSERFMARKGDKPEEMGELLFWAMERILITAKRPEPQKDRRVGLGAHGAPRLGPPPPQPRPGPQHPRPSAPQRQRRGDADGRERSGRPLLLQPSREGGFRCLGARSHSYCCLDPIPH